MVLKGEASPLPQVATHAPSLLEQARMMVAVLEQQEADRRRLDSVQASVKQLEASEANRKALEERTTQAIYALPSPKVQVPEKSTRAIIHEYISQYVILHGGTGTMYEVCYNAAYRELKKLFGRDINALSKNRKGISKLQITEDQGLIEELYAIVHKLFPLG
jgi:hypothetical protein